MSDLTLTPNQTEVIDWLKQQRFNNVTATPERFAQFKSEFMEQLNHLELKVPNQAPDAQTLFYSGKVDERMAWKIAEDIGEHSNGRIITIGETELGKLANNEKVFQTVLNEVFDENAPAHLRTELDDTLWNTASQRLAHEASGQVLTITPNAERHKVFAQTELPELLQNQQVSSIDGIPRTELVQMRDALQSKGYSPEAAKDAVQSRIAVQSATRLQQEGIQAVGDVLTHHQSQMRTLLATHHVAIDSPNPIVQNLRANGASEEMIQSVLNAHPKPLQPDTPFHAAHKQTQLNPNEPEVTRTKRPIEYGPPLGMSTYNDFVHEESIKQAAESKVINQSVVQAQAQTNERLKAVSDEIKASRVSNLGVQGVGAAATAFDMYTGYQETKEVMNQQTTYKDQITTGVIEGVNRVGRGITAGSGAVVGGAAASEIPVIGTIAGGMAGYEASGRFYDANVAPVVKSALKPVAETVYQYGTEQGRTETKISNLQTQISQTTGLEQQNLQEQLKRTSRDYSKTYSANQNEIDARHHNNATINEFQLNNARTQIDNNAVNSRIADKTAAGQSVAQAVTSSRSEVLNERKTADESIYRQLSPQQQASIDKTLSQYNTSFTNAYTLMTWDEARKNLSPNADEFYNRTLAQIKQDDLAVRGNVKDPRDIQIQQAEQAKAAELAREQQREASRPNPNAQPATQIDAYKGSPDKYTPPTNLEGSFKDVNPRLRSDASDYAPAAASVALASANRMDSGHYGDALDGFNQTRSPNFEGVLKAPTTALVEKPTDVQHASMFTEPQPAQPIALPHNLAVLREKLVEKFGNQLDHLSEKDQQTTIALATLEAAKFHVRTVDQIFISPKGDVLMSFDQQRTCSADINLAQVPNYDANQVLEQTINLQQSQQQALAQRQEQSRNQSGPTMTL